jgi:hypothetical protein
MLERLQSDVLKRLYRYWDGKRAGRAAPARAEFDPVEMTSFLPFVFLLDILGPPRRYCIRLMGTAIVAQYGEDATGLHLDEIDLGGANRALIARYDALVETCRPFHDAGQYLKSDGRLLRYERIAMPLSPDGRSVNQVFGGVVAENLGDPASWRR